MPRNKVTDKDKNVRKATVAGAQGGTEGVESFVLYPRITCHPRTLSYLGQGRGVSNGTRGMSGMFLGQLERVENPTSDLKLDLFV